MNKNTIITYSAGGNSVVFRSAENSPFWITSITGASSNSISISEAQGTGQIGSTIGNQSIQPRDITINGALISDIDTNRKALLACIIPGVTGILTVTDGGISWYVEGSPKNTPEISDGLTLQTFQFSLHCAYPYWRSVENQPEQIAGLNKLFSFPRSFSGSWYISQYTASLFTIVNNTGAAPSSFEVTFTAVTAVTNPELYHVERQAYIKINKILAAGEKMIVSTVYGRRGVIYVQADGTESNGFRFLDVGSDMDLQLDPGDNTLRCGADNNREGLLVQLVAPKGVRQGI